MQNWLDTKMRTESSHSHTFNKRMGHDSDGGRVGDNRVTRNRAQEESGGVTKFKKNRAEKRELRLPFLFLFYHCQRNVGETKAVIASGTS